MANPLLMLFGRMAPAGPGCLHIGSRIPLDLPSLRGRNTLVDPYFASIPKAALRKLQGGCPSVEFVPKKAHEFLDNAIAAGLVYDEIRMDCPYTGIIDESSDFASLCRKISRVLKPGGKMGILTEYDPSVSGTVHKFSGDDATGMNKLLKGREFSELSEKEVKRLRKSVREEKTANICADLRAAGFKVRYSEAPLSVIRRSETALKRAASGKTLYLVVAKNR